MKSNTWCEAEAGESDRPVPMRGSIYHEGLKAHQGHEDSVGWQRGLPDLGGLPLLRGIAGRGSRHSASIKARGLSKYPDA